jgi:predicted deacylase/putative intracellular protease/amidase
MAGWFGLAQFSSVSCAEPPNPVVSTNILCPGSPFATEIYVHNSGVPGPVIMIAGGAHGNEPAGALAAERIRHWPLLRGKLVVVPRANVPALNAGKRLSPGVAKELANLNRNYPRAEKTEPPRGEAAGAIWAAALEHHPDWVLDLHEGFDFHSVNSNSVGSSIIAFPETTCLQAANSMLTAVNGSVTNPSAKFVVRRGPVDGSLARAAGAVLQIPAMTLETTSKQPIELRVSQHQIMVRQLFLDLGMLENRRDGIASTTNSPFATAREPLRIALYQGAGTGGAGPTNLLRKLNVPGHAAIRQISAAEIQSGTLSQFEVVIFAGGSASRQAAALEEAGRAAVQQFVRRGGGYIGICAGAYLATSGYSWSLKLINAKTLSSKWQRGRGQVKVELSPAGQTMLGSRAGLLDVLYANGPVVGAANQADLPDYEVLAWFRTELAQHDTPVGIMVNSPAIFAASCQRGRVVCISPHPEQTDGLEDFVPRAVAWVSKRTDSVESPISHSTTKSSSPTSPTPTL